MTTDIAALDLAKLVARISKNCEVARQVTHVDVVESGRAVMSERISVIEAEALLATITRLRTLLGEALEYARETTPLRRADVHDRLLAIREESKR